MDQLPEWEALPNQTDARPGWETRCRAHPAAVLNAATAAYGNDHWERADCPAWWQRVIAECLWRTGKADGAHRILLALRSHADLPPCVRALTELNLSEFFKESMAAADLRGTRVSARQLADQAGRRDIRAMADLSDGVDCYLAGDYEQAINYYEQAIACFQELEMPVEEAGVLGNLALCTQAVGRFEEAIGHYQRTVELGEAAGDQLALGRAHYNLSCLLRDSGDYDGAAASLDAALSVMQELQHFRGMALVSNALGVLYYRMGRHAAAIEAYHTSIKWKQEIEAVGDYATSWINLGECLLKTGQAVEAQDAFSSALRSVDDHGPERMRWACHFGLAQVAWERGDFDAVREPLMSAIRYVVGARERVNLSDLLGQVLEWAVSPQRAATRDWTCEVVDIMGIDQQPCAVAALFEFAVQDARERQAKAQMARLLRTYSIWLEQQTLLVEAIQAAREAHDIERSTINEQSERRRAALTARFQLERSHQMALVEQREKEVLRDALDRVVQSHTEKQELLEMVAHDLRNGLGAIRNMGQLLTSPIGSSMEATARNDAIKGIRTTATGMLHALNDMLAGGASTARPASQPSVDLCRIARSVVDLQLASAQQRGITICCAFQPEAVWLRQPAAWLREVVDNLLSNAIKYSPENAEVRVSISLSNDCCQLSVADAGSGVPEEQVPLLFSRFGLEAREGVAGTGIGLSIVKRLADRMNAHCSYLNAPGGGACFRIDFPAWNG